MFMFQLLASFIIVLILVKFKKKLCYVQIMLSDFGGHGISFIIICNPYSRTIYHHWLHFASILPWQLKVVISQFIFVPVLGFYFLIL